MHEDNELFWELLRPHYQAVAAYCCRLTGDPDSGNDLLHDALIIGLKAFANLRDSNSFRAWLYRIVVTTYCSRFRQPWWRKRTVLTEELLADFESANTEDALVAKRWLERAFEALSPSERATITLYELEGWSVTELAKMFKKTESAIKVELHRSRKKMKNKLVKFIRRAERVGRKIKRTTEEAPCAAAKSVGD